MTPGVLDYLGDIGGLNDIVFTIFAGFLSTYSTYRTYAIIMNRLYHLGDSFDEGKKAISSLKETPTLLIEGTKDFNAFELNVPMLLDWKLLFHKLILFRCWPSCCKNLSYCRKRRSFDTYQTLIEHTESLV